MEFFKNKYLFVYIKNNASGKFLNTSEDMRCRTAGKLWSISFGYLTYKFILYLYKQ